MIDIKFLWLIGLFVLPFVPYFIFNPSKFRLITRYIPRINFVSEDKK